MKMDKRKAKHLGSKFGIRSVTAGLIMAQVIMSVFFYNKSDGIIKAILWFTEKDYWLNLLAGIAILYLCGYFYGQASGKQVLINHKNYNLVGFKFAMFTLVTSTVISCCINFLMVGVDKVGRQGEHPITDYILNPILFILLFGLIPSLIIGFWFGKQLRKRLRF
jgi:hypothetical protein